MLSGVRDLEKGVRSIIRKKKICVLKRNFIQTVVQTGDTLFLSYSLCPSVYTIDYQHYRSLPQYTGSWGNRFQETHGIWIYFWFAVNTTTGSTVKRSNLSLQSSLVLGKNTNLRLLIIHLISNTNIFVTTVKKETNRAFIDMYFTELFVTVM